MISGQLGKIFETCPRLLDRVHVLADRPVREGADYVLCWTQQVLRLDENPLLDAAICIGNALGLPVLIYHGVSQRYPHASDRLHWMLLGGSRDMARAAETRSVRMVSHIVRPGHEICGLVYRLAARAACVVVEDHPTYVASWQSRSFARKASCPVLAVDGARLVPYRTLPEGLGSTKAFRKASGERRELFLEPSPGLEPTQPPYDGPLDFEPDALGDMDDAGLRALISDCDIDHTLPSCEAHPPSRAAALERLEQFVDHSLSRYKWERNNPASDHAGSRLSPYLHFGFIAPWEVAFAVKSSDRHAAAKWKFLDEMLTWREWFHYRALHTPEFERFDSLPARARETLLDHADDPRDPLYDMEALLHGRTEDESWNAAQRQWLVDGYMHNNLRMYWGKKLIEWTPDPETAWNVACYINDRISLDGRDPATYGNLRWCFGEARPAYREASLYGWVAPKSDRALRKRAGVSDWLRAMASRDVPRIASPDGYPDAPRASDLPSD